MCKNFMKKLFNIFRSKGLFKLFVPLDHYYSPFFFCNSLMKEEYQNKSIIKNYKDFSIEIDEKTILQNTIDLIEIDNNINHIENDFFNLTDSIILRNFIMKNKPQKIIEIGCGHSSRIIYEANIKIGNKISITNIDPYLKRFTMANKDLNMTKHKIIQSSLQDCDLKLFKDLKEGDLLFYDGSHVTKTFSDVNFFFFNILPILSPGVIIHIHDIFDNFEYPLEWIQQNRSWNESYLLRAFLMNNKDYSVILFNDIVGKRYQNKISQYCKKEHFHGGSIYLKKNESQK